MPGLAQRLYLQPGSFPQPKKKSQHSREVRFGLPDSDYPAETTPPPLCPSRGVLHRILQECGKLSLAFCECGKLPYLSTIGLWRTQNVETRVLSDAMRARESNHVRTSFVRSIVKIGIRKDHRPL